MGHGGCRLPYILLTRYFQRSWNFYPMYKLMAKLLRILAKIGYEDALGRQVRSTSRGMHTTPKDLR